MKLTVLTGIGILMMSTLAYGQDDDKNLVKNPGFESVDGRLKKLKQIELANTWIAPTKEAADLYSNSVNSVEVSAPLNYHGHEDPQEGGNYAGIRVYSHNDKEPRTYLSTELLGSLKKGLKYCVSFKVSLSDKSKYASNNISAYVAKKPLMAVEEKISFILEENVQLAQHSKNKVYNAQYGWETVCTILEADGGEKWLTIGNFKSNDNTKTERMKKPKIDGVNLAGAQTYDAYYYIDDVQVFLLDDVSECECEKDISTDEPDIIYRKTVISKDELDIESLLDASTVYFAQSKTELDNYATDELDIIAARLKDNPEIKIELIGHSDPLETEAGKADPLLKYMAQKRINVVKQHLVDQGISENRIKTTVKDDTEPADDSGTPIGHAKNRRVELKLQ